MSKDRRKDAAVLARREATRFIETANAWLALPDEVQIGASREGGEMKRRSMDLTRALARLRNPWREGR